MGTPVALASLALTSVTYTMPASASPSVTLVTTPPTFCSSLTGLTVTPAFLKMVVATTPHGTAGAQTTTLMAGLARSLTVLMFLGLPFSTKISPVLRAKSCGVPDALPALVTVSMFLGAAEAKTSAGAPWFDGGGQRGTAVVVELHRHARVRRLELGADLVERLGQRGGREHCYRPGDVSRCRRRTPRRRRAGR